MINRAMSRARTRKISRKKKTATIMLELPRYSRVVESEDSSSLTVIIGSTNVS